MTDHPILLSAPMVRAILDGRKTQTRRLLKPQRERPFWELYSPWLLDKTRFKLGDRLWVREPMDKYSPIAPMISKNPQGGSSMVRYLADRHPYPGEGWKAHGITHASRRASRITLNVTDVRVHRIQDISKEDAREEGLLYYDPAIDLIMNQNTMTFENVYISGWSFNEDHPLSTDIHTDPRHAFADLWCSINSDLPRSNTLDKDMWEANPWVVAYTFTVEKKNIVQLEAV